MAWEMAVYTAAWRGSSSSGAAPRELEAAAASRAARRPAGAGGWVTAPLLDAPPPPPAQQPPAAAGAATNSGATPLSAAAAAAAEPAQPSRPDGEEPWRAALRALGGDPSDPAVCDLVRRGRAFRGDAAMSAAAAQALLTCHHALHGAGLFDGGAGADAAAPLASAAALAAALAPARAAGVRCIAVHGGADAVCAPANAFALAEAWPEADVAIIGGAGHSMYDPAVTHELVTATDRLAAEWRARAAGAGAGGGGGGAAALYG